MRLYVYDCMDACMHGGMDECMDAAMHACTHHALVTFKAHLGHDLDMYYTWSGHVPDLIETCCRHDLELFQTYVGHHPDMI